MVDLETIEALYENVCIQAAHNRAQQRASYLKVIVNLAESTAGGAGEDQETLRDVRRRGC